MDWGLGGFEWGSTYEEPSLKKIYIFLVEL
jgi:hypothetical protein